MRPLRRLLLAGAVALAPIAAAQAQVPYTVAGTSLGPWQDLGDCQLTSISSATALSACTGGIPKNTQYAIIQVEVNSARWRADGTAPTASVGMPLSVGAQMYWTTDLVSSLQLIPQTGSMTIDVTFIGIK